MLDFGQRHPPRLAGEGRFHAFLLDVGWQAARHQSLVAHAGRWLPERLAARRAPIPLTFDVDHDTPGVDGQIEEGLLSGLFHRVVGRRFGVTRLGFLWPILLPFLGEGE